MDDGWIMRVRERAYVIWRRQGCPEGRAADNWHEAEHELIAEEHKGGFPDPYTYLPPGSAQKARAGF